MEVIERLRGERQGQLRPDPVPRSAQAQRDPGLVEHILEVASIAIEDPTSDSYPLLAETLLAIEDRTPDSYPLIDDSASAATRAARWRRWSGIVHDFVRLVDYGLDSRDRSRAVAETEFGACPPTLRNLAHHVTSIIDRLLAVAAGWDQEAERQEALASPVTAAVAGPATQQAEDFDEETRQSEEGGNAQ